MECRRVALIAFITLTATLVIGCGKPFVWDIEIEKQRVDDDVPLGSSLEFVESYLDENSVEHSWIEDEKRILGIKRDVKHNVPISTSVQYQFSFDKSNELIAISIEEVHTGP